MPSFASLLDTQHVDLRFDFTAASGWDVRVRDSDANAFSDSGSTLLYASAGAQQTRPAGDQFDFLGVASGEPIFILPQTQNTSLLYLGASAEGTAPADLGSYLETDPRVNNTFQWIRVDLVDARGPGELSVYQTDSFGTPVVWMTTADGIGDTDALFVGAGGHLHYNWAFTERGIYELDLRASAFRGPGQTNPTQSEVFTFFVSVDPPAPVNTVPGDQATAVDTTLAFSAATGNAISVAGPFTSPCDLRIALSVDQGTLDLPAAGLTVVGGALGSSAVTVVGQEAALNAALGGLTYTPPAGFAGTATLTITTDDQGAYHPPPNNVLSDTDTVTIAVSGTAPPPPPGVPPPPVSPPGVPPPGVPPPGVPPTPGVPPPVAPSGKLIAVGAGPGGAPHVRVLDANTGAEVQSFFAYDSSFRDGVAVAVGDVNGDGTPDVITGPGPGGGPHVRVVDGVTGAELHSFFAFDPAFRGGLSVAAGDTTGDGRAEIVVAAGPGGGPHVKVFDGRTGRMLRSFFAFDGPFTAGVNVTAGDLDNDGRDEIIAAPASGGVAPLVRVFDGTTGGLRNSLATPSGPFDGGISVAAGDITGDRNAEVLLAVPNSPSVEVFDPRTGLFRSGLNAAFDRRGGGRFIAGADLNGDGIVDLISGPRAGAPPTVVVVSGSDGTILRSFSAFAEDFFGGVYVGMG